MRVATFNILHGRSPADDRVDIDRFVASLCALEADVLALQEVDRNQPRSEGVDLTAIAAEELGLPEHRFVAALSGNPGAMWLAADGEEQPDSAAYGIAILSRYPVHSWEVVRLAPVPVKVPMRFTGSKGATWVRDEPRVALAATIDSPCGELTVANTHLTFVPWWSPHQLRTLRRSLPATDRLLLTGDLNMGSARAERLSRMRSLVGAATFPADRPTQQLDHVLAGRGFDLRVIAGRSHRLPVSDHRALSIDLARGAEGPTPFS